jgi:pimeloyl-ACP methyl ester carboxylesterase
MQRDWLRFCYQFKGQILILNHRFFARCLLIFAAITNSALALAGASAQTDRAIDATVPSRFDQTPIRYHVRGDGAATIIFIHCWMGNSSFWDRQVAQFSDRYRVVTMDLPGHGESGKDREKWTLAAYGEDVQTVADALHAENIVLVGHSMGGYVMLEAARQLKSRVVGMIAIDTLQDAEHPDDPKEMEAFVAALRKDFPAATRSLVRAITGPNAGPEVVEKLSATMGAGNPAIGVALMQEMSRYDLAAGFRATRAPMVALNSRMFPTNIDGNRKFLSSFELIPLPEGVGHFPQFESPQAFDELLHQAIAKVTARMDFKR